MERIAPEKEQVSQLRPLKFFNFIITNLTLQKDGIINFTEDRVA